MGQIIPTKPVWQSTTLWGGALLLLAFVLQTYFGIETTEEETAIVREAINSGDYALVASAIITFIMVVVGRYKASMPVSVLGKPKSPVWLLLLLPTLSLVGCVANAPMIEAADQYLDTAGDEYLQYVDADDALTEDDRAIRHLHHDTFRRAVDEAQLNSNNSWF